MRAADEKPRDRASVIPLRPHHLLCLHGFRGLGYSDAFVANMRQVKERLEADSTIVEVRPAPDAICTACPHLHTRPQCTRDGGSDRDRAVAAALGIVPGTVQSWQYWVALVARRMSPALMAEICGDCSWFPLGYCVEGIAALRRGKQPTLTRPAGASW